MNEKKFDGKGEIYSKFRPCYPKELIDYLFTNVGVTKNSTIADIGSGTGILTKQFIECVNTIYAVEPNESMKKIAENDLGNYNNFISVNGTAEKTTLENASVDFVTVAQAFHWFDRAKFKTECKRILKPKGKVILVWNCRDENSALVKENYQINLKYCPDFKGFSGGMRGVTSDNDFSDFFSGKYYTKVCPNPLSFSEQGFIGRNLSASYALKEDNVNYQAYISELKELFKKHSQNKKLTMPNLTQVYVGNL